MLNYSTLVNLRRIGVLIIAWVIYANIMLWHDHLFLVATQPGALPENYSLKAAFVTHMLGAIVAGSLLGFIEYFYFERLFRHRSLGFSMVFKAIIHVSVYVIISLILNFAYGMIKLGNHNPFAAEVVALTFDYMFSAHYIANSMFWFLGIIVTVIGIQITNVFGPGVLARFVFGRYKHPRCEERIFMFLDLASSTTIAEKLGAQKFFEFIQEFINDITSTIIRYGGDIYKYVGDEVIISWPKRRGAYNAQCVHCFFELRNHLQLLTEKYELKYSTVPSFRAGLHIGEAMVGELGRVKKEIAYSGDVLNTTARIQAQCSPLEADLLLSSNLLNEINLEGSGLAARDQGAQELRGKQETVQLYAIGYGA